MVRLDVIVRRMVDRLSIANHDRLRRFMTKSRPCSDRVRKMPVCLDDHHIYIGSDETDLAIHTRADPARRAVFEQYDGTLKGFVKETIEAVDRVNINKIC